jgi:GWxTD domain-containing protein
MNILESWLQSPMIEALGWTLLHSLWQGALIAAMLAAVLLVVRSPKGRYSSACLALLIMVASFAATFAQQHYSSASGSRSLAYQELPPWRVAYSPKALPSFSLLDVAVPWMTVLWMAGVCLFYLRYAMGSVSLYRLRRRGICCVPNQWEQRLAQLADRVQISRPVQLFESALADTPMVLGHFRPFILLPVGLIAGLPADQLEAILLHELAHIRRHDYLINAWQRLADGLFFYHPAVWWFSGIIRTERENCADDIAVALSGNVHGYAEALHALEGRRVTTLEPRVAITGGNLMKRIQRLLYPERQTSGWIPLFAIFIVIASSSVVFAAWRAEPPSAMPVNSQSSSIEPASSPYKKWLSEDVVYIIDDKERAAFEKLTTNEERHQFVEQFWQRRDPTPNTSENEFKIEHYRRITFANEKFTTGSGTPGWQTDRGHIYIVYGPPDEIDSHPQHEPFPVEFWRYRRVEGLSDEIAITFADRSKSGDYRLAPGNTPNSGSTFREAR